MGRGRARDPARALTVALWLGAACRSTAPDDAPSAAVDPAPDGWVLDGCAAMLDRTHCAVEGEARLRLWSPLTEGAWTFRGDAGPLEVDESVSEDGRLYAFTLPRATTRVSGRAAAGSIALTITHDLEPTPALADLRDAIVRRRQAFMDERWDATVALADENFAAATALGRWTEACAASFAAAHVLAEYVGDLDGAASRLDRIADCVAIDRAQSTRAHYHRGRIAALRGDERAAIVEFREAARDAARLNRLDDELAATAAHAELARVLGDAASLDRLATRAEHAAAQHGDSCGAAMAMSSVAWAQLMVAEHDQVAVDPRPLLRRALVTLSRDDCRRPSVIAHAQLDLALAELQADAIAEAEATLAAIEPADLDLGATQWFHDLRIRAALAAGHPGTAWPDLAALERWAELQDDDELRWRAALRRGELELASGRTDRGIASLRTAEAAIDRLTFEVALDLGRPEYSSQHGRSASLLVSALVEHGRADEALCAARRARARGVRPLAITTRAGARSPAVVAARTQWQAAREQLDRAEVDGRDLPQALLTAHRDTIARARAELRAALVDGVGDANEPDPTSCPDPLPRASGRVTLVYAPAAVGWLGFADDAAGLVALELGAIDPAAPRDRLAHAMLGPFADRIGGAREVVVIAQGAALAVPIHALPWRDAPLVAGRVVAWSLDLGAAPRRAAGTTAAVVFADARDDLHHLRPEVTALAQRMTEHGWSVVGDVGARSRGVDVRRALADVRLFHYLGHVGPPGSELGRENPWSNMMLLDEGTIGIDDVLALPRVPDTVVLLGCGTALGDTTPRGSGEGLAQAFLAAGARQAIASVGDVDAALAAALGNELYEGAASEFDAVLALARAQRRHVARGEDDPVWALRAWTR